jgi:hypothetical protein
VAAPRYVLELLAVVGARNIGDWVGGAQQPSAISRIAGEMPRLDSGSFGVDDGDAPEFRPRDLPGGLSASVGGHVGDACSERTRRPPGEGREWDGLY